MFHDKCNFNGGCNNKPTKLVSPTIRMVAPIERYVPYCGKHARQLSLRGYHMVNK